MAYRTLAAVAAIARLTGCGLTGDVMEMETQNGTWARGGGATSVVQADAKKFRATPGKREVAVTASHRDIEQSLFSPAAAAWVVAQTALETSILSSVASAPTAEHPRKSSFRHSEIEP